MCNLLPITVHIMIHRTTTLTLTPETHVCPNQQVRQRNLDGARRILGQAIGRCPGKEKLFKARAF